MILRALIVAAVVTLSLCACKSSSSPASPGEPDPQATSAARTAALKKQAETRLLSSLGTALPGRIRSHAWFEELSPAGYALIEAIHKSYRAAQLQGATGSIVEIFDYAAAQVWYADGLTDIEAAGLRGIFLAYAESLSDPDAPAIGPALATTIEHHLIEVLSLPESGEIVLLASADEAGAARHALTLAVDALPRIEAMVGKFPYQFLQITVTELPEIVAGASYDEFIALAPDSVDAETVIHELTHSTLYGIFPLWFEEGFAHFVEYHLTDALGEGEALFKSQLRTLGYDQRLDVRPQRGYSFADTIAERAQGFLFVEGLVRLNGIEAVVETIRSLRSQTFSSETLIKTLVQSTPAEQRPQLYAYICTNVRGTALDYCKLQ